MQIKSLSKFELLQILKKEQKNKPTERLIDNLTVFLLDAFKIYIDSQLPKLIEMRSQYINPVDQAEETNLYINDT